MGWLAGDQDDGCVRIHVGPWRRRGSLGPAERAGALCGAMSRRVRGSRARGGLGVWIRRGEDVRTRGCGK